MKTVVHFIPSLGPGGTERFLSSIYKFHPTHRNKHFVVTLISQPDSYSLILNECGVQSLCLSKPGHFPHLLSLIYRCLSGRAILIGWLYIGNTLASLTYMFLILCFRKPANLVWNIRNGLDLSRYGVVTLFFFFLNRLFSFLPNKVIFNSNYSYSTHQLFFPPKRSIVISNGTDQRLFRFSQRLRTIHRARLGITDSQFIIGTVGRNRPEKGFHLLYKVFLTVLEDYPNLHLVIVGAGHDDETYCRHPSITILPHMSSIHEIYSSFDLYLQTSFTESYPNTLAEAMSSSLPCLSTNVGDSPILLNDSQQICTSFVATDLADSLSHLLTKPIPDLLEIGKKNSRRISQTFSRSSTIKYFSQILSDS